MSRQALTVEMRRWIAVVVSAGAVGLAGCGSATSGSSTSGAGASGTSASTTSATTSASTTTSSSSTGTGAGALTIAPARGGPTTRFSLRFVAPASSGPSGGSRVSFTLSLTGGNRAGGCAGPRTVAVPAATKGMPVTIELNPASLGGSWCPGTHTARVVELQGPVCNPGVMCPQYLRVVGTVGETTFTVSRSA